MGKGVDQFWAQLKESTAPKVKPRANADASINKNTFRSTVAGSTPLLVAGMSRSTTHCAASVQQGGTPEAGITWRASPEAVCQHVGRQVEGLKSDTASARSRAAAEVKSVVEYLCKDGNSADLELLSDILTGSLGKMLLRRFDDTSQCCREHCVSSFLTALQACPACVLPLLPYAMPVLEERLCKNTGQATPAEPCEEVRLLLSQLTYQLVRLGGKALAAYAAEVVLLLESMLSDPYHEVNITGCQTLVELNGSMGLRLSSVSKQLVAAVLPLTTHKRHKVRSAALQAVRATMHQGAHEMILEMIAWRDPNVVPVAAFYGDDLKVNFAGKLATDLHPAVRLEWVHTLCDWMVNLRERIDHEPRLLPYLLSALTDPVPSVSEAAVAALERVGKVYEEDHGKELAEVTAYLPMEAQGLGGQQLLSTTTSAARTQPFMVEHPGAGCHDSTGHALRGLRRWPRGVSLPAPLTRPWGLGVTRTVQGQASRSLHALINEMFTWQADSRTSAASLLRTLLALSGDATHQHAQLLVPGLCRAMPDPDVRPLALDCVALLACSLPLSLLLELLLPRLRDSSADTGVQAGIVQLLTAVIRGAAGGADLGSCLPDILAVLDGPTGCMTTNDSTLRHAARQLLSAVIEAAQSECSAEKLRLTVATLHLTTNSAATSTADLLDTSADAGGQAGGGSRHVQQGVLEQLAAAITPDAVDSDLLVCSCMSDMVAACRPLESTNPSLTAAVLGRLLLTAGRSAAADNNGRAEVALQRVWQCMGCALPLVAQGPSRSGELLVTCLLEAVGHVQRSTARALPEGAGMSGETGGMLCQVVCSATGPALEPAMSCVRCCVLQGLVTAEVLVGGWVSEPAECGAGATSRGCLMTAVCEGLARCTTATGRLAACLAIQAMLGCIAVALSAARADQWVSGSASGNGEDASRLTLAEEVERSCDAEGAVRCAAGAMADRLLDSQAAVQLAASDSLCLVVQLVRQCRSVLGEQGGSMGLEVMQLIKNRVQGSKEAVKEGGEVVAGAILRLLNELDSC